MNAHFTFRCFLIIPFFLCSILIASAQKYAPGYVLLNNGDTLQGFIQTENWRLAPEIVHFKKSPTDEVHTYSPLLIHSFRVKGGDWYFSYVGDIDPSSLLDDHLNYDPTPDTLRVAIFIRTVVLGKVSLYYARDKNDRMHLFLQKNGGVISELSYKKYYKDEVVVADYRNEITRRAIMSNQIYKQQLINAFADCPVVSMEILPRPLAYSKNDIMDLVLAYNRCKEAKTVYKEAKEKWKLEVAAHAGINYAGLDFKSSTNTYIGESAFDNSLGVALGLSLNCVLPRTKDSWSIYNELMVRNYTSSGLSGTAPFEEQKQVTMDVVYLKLLTMMRYHFPNGAVRPFLNAGITNSKAIKDENLQTDSSGEQDDFLKNFRSYEQGFLIGGGLTWKKYAADLQLEFSNAMSGYSDVKSSFTTLYVTLGYTF